jgi:la-related protein 1
MMVPGGPGMYYMAPGRPGMPFYPPYPPHPQLAVGVGPNVPQAPQVNLLVRQQIEYYFSVGNLVRDMFLRGNMDTQGWVRAGVIGNFNRMRMLTGGTLDTQILLDCVRDSPVVEIEGDRMRKREDWASWVLPNAAPAQPTQVSVAPAAAGTGAADDATPLQLPIGPGADENGSGVGANGDQQAPAAGASVSDAEVA